MTRKTARDFDPEVLQPFDKYVHGDLSRRGFLQSAGKVAAHVPRIRAEVLVHHAGNDARLLEAWRGYRDALKAAGVATHAGPVRPDPACLRPGPSSLFYPSTS